jgi:hypothetical protein
MKYTLSVALLSFVILSAIPLRPAEALGERFCKEKWDLLNKTEQSKSSQAVSNKHVTCTGN